MRNDANREGLLLKNNPVESRRSLIFNGETYYELNDPNVGYFISRSGKVVSIKQRGARGKMDINNPSYLYTSNNIAGYAQVMFKKGGKRKWYLIHRLLVETFIGNIPEGMVVDHIDGDRQNNNLDNLQILTFKDNLSKGKRFNLGQKMVRLMLNGEEFVFNGIKELLRSKQVNPYTFQIVCAYSLYGERTPMCYENYRLMKYSESQETIEIEIETIN